MKRPKERVINVERFTFIDANNRDKIFAFIDDNNIYFMH